MHPNQILGLIIIFFTVTIGCFAIAFIIAFLKSHRMRIRYPLKSSQYVEDYWMREKKDKRTGAISWKSVFWQKTITCPRPPDKALNVGKRGRLYCECYRVDEDQYIWIADKGVLIEEEIDEDEKVIRRNVVDVKDDGEHKIVDTFEPYDKVQRQELVSQHVKAEMRNKNRWTPEKVMQFAMIGGILMLVALGIIFGGDILKEKAQVEKIKAGNLQLQKDIAQTQAAIAQALGAKIDGVKVEVTQQPTQQQGIAVTTNDEKPPENPDNG